MIKKFTIIAVLLTSITIFLCSCNNSKPVEPYMIKAGKETVSVFESMFELSEHGNVVAASGNVSSDTIIKHMGWTDFGDYIYNDYSPNKENAKKFVLYNGLNGISSTDEIAKVLGDDCVKFSANGEIDCFEAFIDGVKIDYSQIDFSEAETMSDYSQTIRAYCEEQIGESDGNYIIINYICFGSGKTSISISAFKKSN